MYTKSIENTFSKSNKRAERNHQIAAKKRHEPTWDLTRDESQLGDLLNWYSYHQSSKESQKYFVDFLKLHKYDSTLTKSVSEAPPWMVSNIGFLCRIITNNNDSTINNQLLVKYKNHIDMILEKTKDYADGLRLKKRISSKSRTPIIKPTSLDEVNTLIAEIEYQIDIYFANGGENIFNFEKFLHDQEVSSIQSKNIEEYYKKGLLTELQLAYSREDEQLKEGYSHLSRPRLKKYISYIENIIEACNSYWIARNQIEQTNRKPSHRRPRPPLQQIKALKYLDSHDDLKSIPPTKIIGAQQLWIYNIKNKKLGVYVAASSNGFEIKGSTLLNYDPKRSITKTVRKPTEILNEVRKAGKVQLRKLLTSLRTKESKLNGRINKNHVLVRVL